MSRRFDFFDNWMRERFTSFSVVVLIEHKLCLRVCSLLVHLDALFYTIPWSSRIENNTQV